MRLNKKKSLKKSLTFSIIVMIILFCGSILSFHLFGNSQNHKDVEMVQFNNIHGLLNELDITVNQLDDFMNDYTKEHNPDSLKKYNELVDIYYGEKIRSDSQYIVYPGKKESFRNLITKEIDNYHSSYKNQTTQILELVDQMITVQQQNLESNTTNLSANVTYLSNQQEIHNKIQDFILKIVNHQDDVINNFNQEILIFNILAYFFMFALLIYGLCFTRRVYRLIIKPVMLGYQVINKINNGEDKIRLSYNYNNEISDLVDSFNKYIDISQDSIKLIQDQYTRLKLYSDIGEINYFEYSFEKKEVTIFYSQKFVDKYHIKDNIMHYTVAEYVKLIHPDDADEILEQIQLIKNLENKEYKVNFRVKYPQADTYCHVSTTGQIDEKQLYFIGVQFDITYLINIQQKLKEQQENYRLIVENTTDLIGKISLDGKFLYMSKSYKDVFNGIKDNINDFNPMLKVSNGEWLQNVLKPPYSTQELILLDSPNGERWISWNNDAIRNEKNEIEYIVTVGHDITELKKMNDKLKYDSEHDILTGLLNRRGIFNQLNKLEVNTLAAFFIDVNKFKTINDFYGHNFGDEIIKRIAKDLLVYEKYNCIIGRLSGDEFLVLVPNFYEEYSLNFIKNHITKNMHKNYRVDNNDIYISASIGYALYPYDTDDLDKLISYADISMYESKLSHMESCLRFSPEMFKVVDNKVKLASDLKHAIDHDEFEIYIQNIVSVETNEIEYIESLARWNSKNGIIMPDVFFPIAEESGFIQSLDTLLIQKTLRLYKELKQLDQYRNTKLSLNVSPLLLLKNDFPTLLLDYAKNQDLNSEDICIEISENTFMNNIDQSQQQIALLREVGFKIAIDDFGREYSSLSILNRVGFDIIKIDRIFASNFNSTNIEIIKMIINIANLMNNQVIVEGIETKEQKALLNELGCDLMQGFYFHRPEKISMDLLNRK